MSRLRCHQLLFIFGLNGFLALAAGLCIPFASTTKSGYLVHTSQVSENTGGKCKWKLDDSHLGSSANRMMVFKVLKGNVVNSDAQFNFWLPDQPGKKYSSSDSPWCRVYLKAGSDVRQCESVLRRKDLCSSEVKTLNTWPPVITSGFYRFSAIMSYQFSYCDENIVAETTPTTACLKKASTTVTTTTTTTTTTATATVARTNRAEATTTGVATESRTFVTSPVSKIYSLSTNFLSTTSSNNTSTMPPSEMAGNMQSTSLSKGFNVTVVIVIITATVVLAIFCLLIVFSLIQNRRQHRWLRNAATLQFTKRNNQLRNALPPFPELVIEQQGRHPIPNPSALEHDYAVIDVASRPDNDDYLVPNPQPVPEYLDFNEPP